MFYDWFLEHHASTIKDSMLYGVRRSAGLGNPPSPYYTNAVESMNSLLKLRTNFKKQELTVFICKLKELVDNQFAEVDKAVAGIGDYAMHEDYKKFCFTSARWFTLSEDQRQRALKRFQSILPAQKDVTLTQNIASSTSFTSQHSEGDENGSEEPPNRQHKDNLIAVLAIPQYIADTIWQRALALLQQDSNFALAPGNSGKAWLVTRSSSSKTTKPCFVQNHKGHYECETDCIYYQTSKVCAHIVAVAIKNGDLDRFITWHKKQDHQINTTKLAQSGLPMSCVGKKKAARKGVSKQKSAKIQKICAESDDASWKLRPALIGNSGTATTVQNQLSMSVNIHPSSSAVIMPSQISTLPSQATGIMPSQMPTLPSQATGIMPSQISTLPSQATGSQMSPIFPAPLNPFTLIFLHGNISVCSGCHQRFPRKPNGEYADPPYDMAIQHVEPRMYNSPITGMPNSKIGNAYYHVYLPCLQYNWPIISANDITIPFELKAMLLYEHKILLLRNLGITL